MQKSNYDDWFRGFAVSWFRLFSKKFTNKHKIIACEQTQYKKKARLLRISSLFFTRSNVACKKRMFLSSDIRQQHKQKLSAARRIFLILWWPEAVQTGWLEACLISSLLMVSVAFCGLVNRRKSGLRRWPVWLRRSNMSWVPLQRTRSIFPQPREQQKKKPNRKHWASTRLLYCFIYCLITEVISYKGAN